MTELSNVLALHPFVRQVVVDKIRGTVVGGALGDAIGLYTEFLSKSEIKNVYPSGKFELTGNVTPFFVDTHRSKFTEGEWTDDTDHALLIILSFLHRNGKTLSSVEFARRLKTWVEQGLLCLDRLPVDIGITIGGTVMRSNYLSDPRAAAFKKWKSGRYRNAANGSLMRTHPLGIICLNKSIEDTFDTAIDFSAVTHPDPRCLVSCCIVTALIRGLLLGQVQKEEDIDPLIDKAASYVESWTSQAYTQHPEHDPDSTTLDPPPPLDRPELYKHTRAPTLASLSLSDPAKIGYVYKCLGASIISLRHAMRLSQPQPQTHSTTPTTTPTILSTLQIFETLITALTLEGGDADTNAAVAGALVGSYLGISRLPQHWYRGLKNIEWLVTKTDALIHVLDIEECAVGYLGQADPDTREDGGKGFLDQEQIEARESAAAVGAAKAGAGVEAEGKQQQRLDGGGEGVEEGVGGRKNSAGQALMMKWKQAFG